MGGSIKSASLPVCLSENPSGLAARSGSSNLGANAKRLDLAGTTSVLLSQLFLGKRPSAHPYALSNTMPLSSMSTIAPSSISGRISRVVRRVRYDGINSVVRQWMLRRRSA